ncbi:MAG: DNA alkylation repair protein [Bacteroidia bacterium]|nr:DNA alkylation repair protein [Bacteroidia bacterium]NNJ54526.1 DNA alkylation repair protein [Bacteroidia bacterium]
MNWIETIRYRFTQNEDVNRAVQMKAYMRGQYEYFGIMATPRKEITKLVYKDLGLPENPIAVAKKLFELPQREFHYVAQEMMLKCKKQWAKAVIKDIEWFIITNSWWDTVDYIAVNLAGEYFRKWPEEIKKTTSKWNKSDNIWMVRSSILFQLKYKKDTDKELLSSVILPHISQKEFFIKKAIGWALREYFKTNRDWVLDFVNNHELQPLSRKEALKNF